METEFEGWLSNEISFDGCGVRDDIIKVHNARIMKEYAKDKSAKEPLFSYVATSIEDFAKLLEEVGFTLLDVLRQIESFSMFDANDEIFYLSNEGHDINSSDASDATDNGLIDIHDLAEYIWDSDEEACKSIVEEYEDYTAEDDEEEEV